jgi:hypothetical protein
MFHESDETSVQDCYLRHRWVSAHAQKIQHLGKRSLTYDLFDEIDTANDYSVRRGVRNVRIQSGHVDFLG